MTLQPFGPIPKWKSVFDYNFNGNSLPSNTWVELPSYGNLQTLPQNVKIFNSLCHLTCSDPDGAAISTSDWTTPIGPQFEVGQYIEARILLPSAGTETSIYNWPAFWTSGPNWPESGEIDIVEILSGVATTNYHYGTPDDPQAQNSNQIPGNWGNNFHVYGCWRQPTKAEIYWDGELIYTHPTSDNGDPHAVIITQGPATDPAYTKAGAVVVVDWVRIWEPA